MKRLIIGIILLAVVAVGAFFVLQMLPKARVSSLESLVPEDALLYVYSFNPDKKVKELQASEFFGKLSKLAVYKDLIEPKIKEVFQNTPFLSGFLDEDMAVSLFSLSNLVNLQADISNAGDYMLLVRLNPKKRAQIQREVLDAYLSVAGKGKASFRTFKGIKISKYTSIKPAFTVNYAFIADVLVLSNSANVIEKSLELYQAKPGKDKKSSLSENKNFQNIKNRVKKDAWIWGYQNNERYNQQMMAYYTSGALRSKGGRWAAYAMDPTQFAPMVDLMNLIKASGFSLERDALKEGFFLRGYHLIGQPKTKPIVELFKFISDAKTLDEQVMRLVPRDVMLYVGGCKDISALWRFFKYALTQTPQLSSGASKDIKANLAKLDYFLGVDMEKDLLADLGDNFGLAVTNLENMQLNMFGAVEPPTSSQKGLSIAIPQVFTYLELKDVPKMRVLLENAASKLINRANEKIAERERQWQQGLKNPPAEQGGQQGPAAQPAASRPLSLLKDTYQGTQINYLEMSNFPLASFTPNYCIVDKYLIFSYSLPLTKKIIDLDKNKGSSFLKNANFLSTRNKISAKFSDIAFFDIEHSVQELKRVKFFDSMIYQMARGAATAATKEELDQVLSIFENLVSVTSFYKPMEQDAIETDMYIKIKGL